MSSSVLNTTTVFAKGDSGATSHYIRLEDTSSCLKNVESYEGPEVMLPDAGTIAPTLKGQLSLSNKFSKQAQTATALPALKSFSIVSLGHLCDDNCTVILDKHKLLAIKKDEIILQGRRNYLDGLWDIPIQKAQLQADNYNFPKNRGFQYNQRSKNIIKEPIFDFKTTENTRLKKNGWT